MIRIEKIIKKHTKRKARLGLNWNNGWIDFCSVDFKSDGTFIFVSKFHTGNIEFGNAEIKDNSFHNQEKDNSLNIKNGCHISLHPKKQIMHLKENSLGKIIDKREINWFPVTKPFNLLYLFSPPLDQCIFSKKPTHFFSPISTNYKDSIQVKVDIFPRDTKVHYPNTNSIWIFWGYCPNYFVRISFNLINQRIQALIYWPLGSKLIL